MASHRRVFLTACLLLGATLCVLFWVDSRRESVKVVHFQRAASAQPRGLDDTRRPELRIAIGAMISPAITKRYYEDLMRLVGRRIGRQSVLIQRKTYAEVNALVEDRTVDLALVCSGPYVVGHQKFGMEIIAVPIVGKANTYHSYIIANSNSGVKSFDELRGKRFAFTDPDSNTGFLVPNFMLAQRGETPESFFRETIFTHSHDNSIKSVALGVTDGAAVDSLIWEFLRWSEPETVANTMVVGTSPPYGIPPVVVHPGLDPVLKAELRKTFLWVHEDPIARALLEKLRIDRFEAASDGLYQTVREMQNWLSAKK